MAQPLLPFSHPYLPRFEPYLNDEEEIDVKAGGGRGCVVALSQRTGFPLGRWRVRARE